MTAWVRVMAQRPAKLPSSERLLGLPTLADIYADRPDVPRMSQTPLSRHVANLSSLWTKAQGDGHIAEEATNPFGRRKFEITPPPEEPQEFSAEELTAIFSLPIFTDGKRPLGGKGEASYWMPLLMLWTGARTADGSISNSPKQGSRACRPTLRKKDDDRNLFHIGSAWKESRAYDAQGDVE